MKPDTVVASVEEFLILWSTATKNRRESDPIADMKKRVRYKELADEGIRLLEPLKSMRDEHKFHFLLGQAYFNKWENHKAIEPIDKAIDLAKDEPECASCYQKFRKAVARQLAKREN